MNGFILVEAKEFKFLKQKIIVWAMQSGCFLFMLIHEIVLFCFVCSLMF